MVMGREPNGSESRAPWLLLAGGAPASGKTRLAQQLAAHYDAALCSKDELKEILFETLGSGAVSPSTDASSEAFALWSRRLSDASFALLFRFAERLLRAERMVLLEGNFRPGEHEAVLAPLLSRTRARLIQVLCEASMATRTARLAARAGDPHRHRVHLDVRIDASRPAPGFLALPGPTLRFDSDRSETDALASLLSELDRALVPA